MFRGVGQVEEGGRGGGGGEGHSFCRQKYPEV